MDQFGRDEPVTQSSNYVLPPSDLEVDRRHHHHDGTDGLQYVPSKEVEPQPRHESFSSLHKSRKRILGLSVGMFWVVVAVIVLVFACAIGGGVAGGLVAQKNSCSPSQQSMALPATTSTPQASSTSSQLASSTSSSSTSSAATAGASPQIVTPCTGNNAANGSTIVARDSTAANVGLASFPHTFQLLCNTNYPAGSTYGNPDIKDLLRIYAPDMAGCVAACAEYNTGYAVTNGSPKCSVVAVVKAPGEACYLKSGVGVNDTTSSGGIPIDSAVLLNS